jgi:hypothetical protein
MWKCEGAPMGRGRIALAAAVLLLAGCQAQGESVRLLTGELGCYAGGEGGGTGPLLPDRESGTSFLGMPVMWPDGYTARRVGSAVVVLDSHRNIRAITGRTYHISRAYSPTVTPGDGGPFPAAVECGYHWDFIDCTANPIDTWCLIE